MILEEANITPEPVGWQRVDEGVEEGEDYVWVVGRQVVGGFNHYNICVWDYVRLCSFFENKKNLPTCIEVGSFCNCSRDDCRAGCCIRELTINVI